MIGFKNLAAATDLLRFEILRQEGGYYLDADTNFPELTIIHPTEQTYARPQPPINPTEKATEFYQKELALYERQMQERKEDTTSRQKIRDLYHPEKVTAIPDTTALGIKFHIAHRAKDKKDFKYTFNNDLIAGVAHHPFFEQIIKEMIDAHEALDEMQISKEERQTLNTASGFNFQPEISRQDIKRFPIKTTRTHLTLETTGPDRILFHLKEYLKAQTRSLYKNKKPQYDDAASEQEAYEKILNDVAFSADEEMSKIPGLTLEFQETQPKEEQVAPSAKQQLAKVKIVANIRSIPKADANWVKETPQKRSAFDTSSLSERTVRAKYPQAQFLRQEKHAKKPTTIVNNKYYFLLQLKKEVDDKTWDKVGMSWFLSKKAPQGITDLREKLQSLDKLNKKNVKEIEEKFADCLASLSDSADRSGNNEAFDFYVQKHEEARNIIRAKSASLKPTRKG